jgi:hypothetical protein
MSRSGTKRGTGVKHLETNDKRTAACGRRGELSRTDRDGLLTLASVCPQKACKRCLAVLASSGGRLACGCVAGREHHMMCPVRCGIVPPLTCEVCGGSGVRSVDEHEHTCRACLGHGRRQAIP